MLRSTGIVRRVDELGRVVLPKEIRQMRELDSGEPFEIYVKEDWIILQKHRPECVFCSHQEGLVQYQKKDVCKHCVEKMGHELDSMAE